MLHLKLGLGPLGCGARIWREQGQEMDMSLAWMQKGLVVRLSITCRRWIAAWPQETYWCEALLAASTCPTISATSSQRTLLVLSRQSRGGKASCGYHWRACMYVGLNMRIKNFWMNGSIHILMHCIASHWNWNRVMAVETIIEHNSLCRVTWLFPKEVWLQSTSWFFQLDTMLLLLMPLLWVCSSHCATPTCKNVH